MPNPSRRPTDAELDILAVLWTRGPSTVRAVYEELGKDSGYTTALKILQVMFEKGLVSRDVSQRSHVYSAAVSREDVQSRFLSRIKNQLFDGSAHRLVMRALGEESVSREDLRVIRNLLDELESQKEESREK